MSATDQALVLAGRMTPTDTTLPVEPIDRLTARADAGMRRATAALALALEAGDEEAGALALDRFTVYLDGLKKLATLKRMELSDG